MLYAYVVVTIFLILLGKKITNKWINSITIFCGLWLFIILIYQFGLSNWQYEITNDSYVTFLLNNIFFAAGYLLLYFIKLKNANVNIKKENYIIRYDIIKKLFIFWIIIEIIETIYSGGLPIIWKLTGSSKTYVHYGIPTVHGFMNSISLVIMLLSYYLYIKDDKKNKKLLFIIGSILLFDLMLITRQVIVSALIELFVIYFFFNKKTLPIKRLFILMLVFIISFGLVGNLRTGYEDFLYVSAFKNPNISSFFIGFYWVYMYLVMTIANINNAVIMGISGFGLYPIMESYLPTVISNFLFANSTIEIPKFLVTKAFNVSGYFSHFYVAFGNFGVCLIAFIYGFLGSLLSKKINQHITEKNLLYMAVYIQIIALSFFENHLLYLPSGFQFIIIWFLFKFKFKGDD